MMEILYIGNKLCGKGKTPTTIDTLGKQFEEFVNVKYASEKINPLLRLTDMCLSVFRNPKSKYVIIDTYSTSAFYFAIAVGLCCRITGKKYMPILHGGNLPHRLDNSEFISRQFFRKAYKIVSPSGYLKHEFEKRGYHGIIEIPNNIEIVDCQFKKRDSFCPKLLWVRSFDKTYNCEMAVEVLKLLLKEYPDAELCMIGPDKDGSMQSTIDLAKRYGISDRLKITGRLSKSDWHNLAQKYDIFISTTNFDNTPVSVIEAMALGLPVVSTNVGGMPFLIDDGKNGYLVEKNNASAMANCIKNIIRNSAENTQISVQARHKAETFDWQCVKQLWMEIIK